jgi:hypothetical protein
LPALWPGVVTPITAKTRDQREERIWKAQARAMGS